MNVHGILTIAFFLSSWAAVPGYTGDPGNIKSLKLATWNIKWLSSEINTGKVKRKQEDYARLRKYTAMLDADVIALQEIDGVKALVQVFDPEKYNFELSKRNSVQSVGLAIRKGIVYERNPDYHALGLPGDHLRWGVDVNVKAGEFSLRILCVHLKGGCYEGNLHGSKACRKLQKQLKVLEEWIDKRAEEGMPFCVLGDFNRRINRDDVFWKELDDADPPEADLVNTGEDRVSRCNEGKYPRFIDHIILSKQAAGLLIPGSFNQLLYGKKDEQKFILSDHCPVSVSISMSGNN
jgi:endonuclease/exonuclease/phosphatase family metal-dependent hydrolase